MSPSMATTSTGLKGVRTRPVAMPSSGLRDGRIEDVTPSDFNARTRVHEYGGGAYVVAAGVVYASNFADQRIYRIAANDQPIPITPAGKWFYADATLDRQRQRLIAVREDHSEPDREPITTLVSIPLEGAPSAGDVIASGYDFYSTPRLSPDGSRVVWLSWRHPQMPWDGTELWLADVTEAGMLANQRRIAGGPTESIYQPGWTSDGELYFVSDRDGWWKLYRSEAGVLVEADVPNGCGVRSPAMDLRDNVVGPCRRRTHGRFVHACRTLASCDARHTELVVCRQLAEGFEPREWLAATETHVVLVAGSSTTPDAVVRVDVATGVVETLKSSSAVSFPAALLSVPESVEFPSSDGHDDARVLLPAAQRRLHGARRRTTASHPDRPRRPHDGHERDARSQGAVLDQPWFRGGRRELWRQFRIRQKLSRAAQSDSGAFSTCAT